MDAALRRSPRAAGGSDEMPTLDTVSDLDHAAGRYVNGWRRVLCDIDAWLPPILERERSSSPILLPCGRARGDMWTDGMYARSTPRRAREDEKAVSVCALESGGCVARRVVVRGATTYREIRHTIARRPMHIIIYIIKKRGGDAVSPSSAHIRIDDFVRVALCEL